jgi:hypothetical protein
MMWLPEYGVGAVILTNGDPGWIIRTAFRRKLLEVLFNGKPEAEGQIRAQAAAFYEDMAAERKLLTIPADPAMSSSLAQRYTNPALGEVTVSRMGIALTFDFGEFSSEVGSRKNPDGTTSFITIVPGFNGLEFVVGRSGERRVLTLRDAQHEYVFQEK